MAPCGDGPAGFRMVRWGDESRGCRSGPLLSAMPLMFILTHCLITVPTLVDRLLVVLHTIIHSVGPLLFTPRAPEGRYLL